MKSAQERLSNVLAIRKVCELAANSQKLNHENNAEPISPRSRNLLLYMKDQSFWPTTSQQVGSESKTPEVRKVTVKLG